MLARVEVVATDVDGTLTDPSGHLTPAVLVAIARLEASGVAVIACTGRSAGWGAALASYIRGLVGVVAENGAVWVPAGPEVEPVLLDPPPSLPITAASEVLAVLAARFGVAPGADNAFRLTDRTLPVGPTVPTGAVADAAGAAGLRHTWSSVHHHLSTSTLDKRTGLLAVLALLGLDPAGVLAVGDSVNDAPLLGPGDPSFAVTVGVAGIRHHLAALGPSAPKWITDGDGADGFVELADALAAARPTR